MPGTGPKNFPCVLCSKRTKPNERRKLNKDVQKYLQRAFLLVVNIDSVLCNSCRHKYCGKSSRFDLPRKQNSNNDGDYIPPQKQVGINPTASPPSVSLPIGSTVKTHAYCFICKKPGPKLVVVPSEIRFSIFLEKYVIVPTGSRCCPGHIRDGKINQTELSSMIPTDSSYVNRTTIVDLVKQLRDYARKCSSTRIDFDHIGSMSDSDCANLTGLTKQNFSELCDSVKSTVRNSPVRTTQTSVGIFLLKMKSGMSNNIMSTLFNLSKSSLRRAISSVRRALMARFVPSNLGLQHITREDVIQHHTRPLAQTLFGDIGGNQAILVLDGTYIYIQKSGNFHFQRRSYSLHKGRPLIKPMVVVTTSGYFVTIVGPYLADAKNNDASILNHMLKTNVEDIKNWVHEDDIFVVDRGFRDSLSLLADLGIRAEMPSFLHKGEKQFSTDDANTNRLVTKVRWVVESANARIKNWKYLNHVLPTNQVPHIGDYVRIVCAIANRFFPPLNKTNDAEEDICMGSKMLYLSKQVNLLKEYVEDNSLHRRSAIWKTTTENTVPDFPQLDEEQLRNLTCGTYQLKLSTSYIQEHIDGNCEILLHKEEGNLLRVKIQSRHVAAKAYLLWIRYNVSNVEAWYCKCRAGSRVVGVCAHIAAVVWYLGYAQHCENQSYGVRDWGRCIADASQIPEVVDESDSDESIVEE